MKLHAGNVIIAGADPSKHARSFADTLDTAIGARNFISAAIVYAASGTNASGQNATGAYICLSQYFYFTVRPYARPLFALSPVIQCSLLLCSVSTLSKV